MSEAVIVAALTAAGSVAVAIVGAIGLILVKKVERIRDQVENDHKHPDGTPINMREEQDDRHDEVMETLRGLQKQVGRVEDRVDGHAQQLAAHLAWSAEWSREQERADRELADRIEDTMDPRKDP
ncbi:hypothetical protein [Stenotrophomonas maltophilia]|uniref:hypothetical protein n=1 Tax=Stenotrophomonas maltophilia TaxID=40324 RepID=UPI00301738C9